MARPRRSVMREKALLWREWLESGTVKHQKEIARKAGVCESYVSKVLKELGKH